MMALASCTDLAADRAPGEAAAEPSDYPSLHTVPPRPQLSYTVEQRRAIMDGLVADRENARYSDQVVRYRAGLSGLPPPAEPPVAPAPPAPDGAGAGDAAAPAPPERPVVDAADQFLDEDDDDFDTFLGDLTGDRMEEPGAIAPGPESSAAPLAPTIVRAGAVRPVSAPQTDYDGRPPGVVWAIPVKTAGAPEAPRPKAASAATSPVVAGRAPGVVWGMAGRSSRPAGAAAVATSAAPADQRRESVQAPAAARKPAVTPAAAGKPAPAGPTETAVAGRAPGVVWGMVELPAPPAAPAAAESGVPVADATAPAAAPISPTPAAAAPVQTSGQHGTVEGNQNGAGSAAAVVAERSDRSPPPERQAAAAGIEVGDGLVALAPASGAEPAAAVAAIAFAPGSATLPPDVGARLEGFLAEVKAPDARIRVVGEAATPALALDRALAVGLALVRRGIPADRLDVALAQDAARDQARLSLAPPAP